MQELNLRLGQAVALTYAQTDDNFKRLKTAIDALEVSVAGAGLGTVTSVGLTLPNIFTVTNSPVTTTGSLTATLASQSANSFFASPNGASGQPTFRGLVAADLPTVPINKGGLNLTTVVPINQVLASTGTGYEGRAISVVPFSGLTLTQGTGSIEFSLDPTNINLASLGGVLTVAKGGTGLSAPPANGTLLIGNGVAYTNALLTAGSGISITNAAGAVTIAATSAGVSTLNTLSGNLNMLFGTAAAFPAVVTSGSDIQFNIPDAGPSPVVRGLLTAADWTTFNNKLSSAGTTSYIPKFTASNNIGNSRIFDTGTKIGVNTTNPLWDLDVHSVAPGIPSIIRAYGFSAVASVRAESSLGGSISINTDGTIFSNVNIRINNVTKGALFYTTGNTQINSGFAISAFQSKNDTGNYAFPSNEIYGVILGTGSDGTMTVTLPTSIMDGQEVCILLEEDKANLTIASGSVGRLIYGKSSTPAVTLSLTVNLNTHGSALIFKFSSLGNGGAGGGAWYLTGF
jgi:hypothetical protein